jgi:uncharacterized lipoprotein YajG
MTMRLLIAICALAALAGCAAPAPTLPQPVKVIDTGCNWVKFITTVPADTYETKQQIFAHDKAYLANCPKQ